ncbi:xanthine dehydrogenase family protein molybdopterin-binding subunit [Azospirillum picis]|uniref:Carbon-monoxide dehydrogenase large subunit n=1 Tax=Azospirillum picis TaxID=488438 RepID=A0ABU0MUZ3_9PROT|nr:xanthine dehydrogenase family protein molybdopterin-binding subunit [Azospirillum picis]MBP2303387.1 carbon-monoxide dehydrogenase large subunit [Azospirillum picis]MDQ0537287.1 carbon-monoxide dehydrogenase large subunit [Azospirillum picis]
MSHTGIGARVRRKEDARHLIGRGRFVGDIRMPGLRDVAFLRSTYAHARIVAITRPAGSEGSVYTVDDLAGLSPIVTRSTIPGYKESTHWPLASGKVRFVGEPVVMAVAASRAEAEDLCDAVQVEFDPLPVIASSEAGRAPDAPRVHEEWPDNLFLESGFDSGVDEVARTAPVKVTREYRTARQCMHPMEGKGVLAYWDYQASQLVVVTSTQVPHMIRTGLAECLGLDQSRIRVAPPDVGGGFGYKCVLQPEEVLIAWLALTRKTPFRWVEDRREHLTAGANTRQHQYRVTAYADERGRLLGLDAEVMVDTGAYSVWPFTACLEPSQIAGNLPGPYDFQAYRCKTYTVATNKPAFTPYRGVARTGVCFAMELTIDAIARAVGREPVDVRAENLVTAGQMPFTNVTRKHFDSGDYPASLQRAREMIGMEAVRARQGSGEPDGRHIGLGFATYTEQSAHGTTVFSSWGLSVIPGYDQASVKITPDGGVEVRAGIHTIGQGLETTLAQVASEILTIPIERITVTLGDTATTPYSTGAYASRGIVMSGGATSKAAQTVAGQVRRIAAHLMKCAPEEVELRDGRIFAGNRSIAFADVGFAWYMRPDLLPTDVDSRGLEATEAYKPAVDSGVFSYATHAAVVAVDPETGMVEILDYVIVEDCGRRVNPMIVEGQAYGGTAQGIGTALFEESPYDDLGQPLASTLLDYLLPGPTELPSIRMDHFETLSPYSAHGVKGVGEGGAIAPPAAIVNAINDALAPLGAELTEVPATPERILAAILAARGRRSAGQENAA